MGNAIKVISDYLREFIPALKTECLIIGFGLIIMSLCLLDVVITSGLTGKLTYMVLSPGVTGAGILGGVALVIAAMVMKPVPRDQM